MLGTHKHFTCKDLRAVYLLVKIYEIYEILKMLIFYRLKKKQAWSVNEYFPCCTDGSVGHDVVRP